MVKIKNMFSQKSSPESFKLLDQSEMYQDKISAQWIFPSSKGKTWCLLAGCSCLRAPFPHDADTQGHMVIVANFGNC
jgi:hypothetical protein